MMSLAGVTVDRPTNLVGAPQKVALDDSVIQIPVDRIIRMLIIRHAARPPLWPLLQAPLQAAPRKNRDSLERASEQQLRCPYLIRAYLSLSVWCCVCLGIPETP